MTFESFDLDPRCMRLLDKQDITHPTLIQEKAIPVALEGSDLIATAQTGTGKTLGFVLPSLTLLARDKQRRNRMLVLVPTRELCVQVESVTKDFAKALGLRSTLIYGGVNMNGQITALERGCDIIVATPGRLLDHMGRGNIRFRDLEIVVLDEADRMLDMGFLPDIRRIFAKLPKDRQTMMFSATFPREMDRLAADMTHEPKRLTVGKLAMPVETVRQLLYPVRQEEKSRILLDILRKEKVENALIFLRTKARTDRLGKLLCKSGFNAASIHGDLSQKQRQRALDGFREGRYKFLVATDVAARGLDIDGISHVFNYDVPPTADDYVHRIGRTARADAEGDAITFITPTDFSALSVIERAIGKALPRADYEGAPKVLSLWQPPGKKLGKGVRRGRTRGLLRRR